MKKVLLITYYWPPSGGAGVQRVLKTAKYLRDFGWEPIIYTAENPAYPIIDTSLEEDVPADMQVIKGPIWEPYEVYKRFTGKGKQKQVYSGFLSEDRKPSFTERLSIWIRGNFFIPDARCFWINPSISFLKKRVKELGVEAILSSGPPHSVHMIARGLKRATGLPWIADFRDPWTNIDFYDQLMLTRWADRRHHRMEASILREADKTVTVSWVWSKELQDLGAEDVPVITNGFDAADFQSAPPALTQKFVCSHIGYLNRDRNSGLLWEVFGELAREVEGFRENLEIRFVGKTDFQALQQLESQKLLDCVNRIDYVPHAEVLDYTRSTQVLLLMVNNVPNVMGHIPGKTYEYIGSGRPILAIGPEKADFARVIYETRAGIVCGFEDREKMKASLLAMYEAYLQGKLLGERDEAAALRFTRRASAEKMAGILDALQG